MKTEGFIKRIAFLIVFALVISLAILGVACNEEDDSSTAEVEKVRVVVSISPLAEFVEQVGGDNVEVSIMVPSEADLHIYDPDPSQLVELSKADLYVKVGSGVEFETAYMDSIEKANSRMLVVDSSEGIDLIEMIEHHHEDNNKGEDDHGMDPHVWLSPVNAKTMVENICDSLIDVDPDSEVFYTRNRDDYLKKLDQLDADISGALSGVTNRHFIVFHPAWGYFAQAYELEQIPIEVEGKEPNGEDLAHLIEEALGQDIKIVFASPQFNMESAQIIADEIGNDEYGGRVILIDPLARDYINNLHMVLGEMVQAME